MWNKIKKFEVSTLAYIFMSVFALAVTAVWFSDWKLIYFADTTYPILPVESLKDFFYAWRTSAGAGQIDVTGFAILPFFLFLTIINSLGFSAVATQAIFFFCILLTTGVGMISLLRFFAEEEKMNITFLGYVIPAVFYVTNLYIAVNAWRMVIFLYVFYAVLPILILLFLKYIKTSELKYVLYFSFVTGVVASVALTNLSYLFLLVGFIAVFTFFYKTILIKKVFLVLLSIPIWTALNMWYLLPQFSDINSSLDKATQGSLDGSISILNVISSQASLLNTMTLRGYYALYDTIGGSWFSWSNTYISSPLAVMSFILPIVFVLLLLFASKKVKSGSFFLSCTTLLIFGFILSTGSHDPFGQLFTDLMIKYPVPLLAFRAAYEKLGILVAFGYVGMLFFGIHLLQTKFRKYAVQGILTLLAVIMFFGYPMLSGKIFDSENGIRTEAKIVVPADYYQVANILEQDKTAITLSLPQQNHTWISSKWEDGYLGNDILKLISGTPIISTETGDSFINTTVAAIEKNLDSSDVLEEKNFQKLNATYILVRKDINYEWAAAYGKKMVEYEKIITKLDGSNLFEREFESDNLVLYKNTSDNIYKNIALLDRVFQVEASDFYQQNSINALKQDFGIDTAFTIVDSEQRELSQNFIKPLFEIPKDSKFETSFYEQNIQVGSTKNSLLLNTNPVDVAFDSNFTGTDEESVRLGNIYVNGRALQQRVDYLDVFSEPESEFLIENNSKVSLLSEGVIINTSAPTNIYKLATDSERTEGLFGSEFSATEVGDCNNYDENPVLSMSQLETDLGATIQLEATRHNACVSRKIPVTDSGQEYLLEFDYRGQDAEFVGFNLGFEGDLNPENASYGKKLKISESGNQSYAEIIKVPNGTRSITFHLYSYESDGFKNNVVQYANVFFSKVELVESIGPERHDSFTSVDLGVSEDGVENFLFKDPGHNFRNHISNGSFDDGLWVDAVSNCNNFDDNPILGMQLVSGKDGSALQLEATRHTACTYQTDISVKGGTEYFFEFDYQSENAENAGYYIAFNDVIDSSVSDRPVVDGAEWQTFATSFVTPIGATRMSLHVYSYSSDGKTNVVTQYDNFRLTELPNITNQYYLAGESMVRIEKPESLNFKIINPTKKTVSVRGATTPFYLAMSESHHPQWQLQFANDKIRGFFGSWVPFVSPDVVSSDAHFELNGFLNGWYVDVDQYCRDDGLCVQNADGSYDIEFVIEFFPQRWFYLGLLISSLTLVGCLGYLGFSWNRRRVS